MTINKIRFLIAIFTSLIIFNFITITNVNPFYIGSFVSMLFLLIVPGLLLTHLFNLEEVNIWESLGYSIGLSIALLMILGLSINVLLPFFGIVHPLTFIPLLISLNIIFLIITFFIFRKYKDLTIHIKINISLPNIFFFIIPVILLVFTIFGSISLNNNGSNYLSLYSIIGSCVYIFLLIIFRKKINENLYPWNLFILALSILLMLSLRGAHVSGTDIIKEYRLFILTTNNGLWKNDLYYAYNSCLSVTIIPTILYIFSHVNSEYVYKVIIQIIFAYVPVLVYLFTKKYIQPILSFIGTIFYIAFPIFINAMTMHIRQEIAFLFFSLLLITIFNKKNIQYKIFSYIFGISLILSHYSTAYVMILLFISTYFIRIIFIYTYKIKLLSQILISLHLKSKNSQAYIINNNLGFIFILVMFIATNLWYSTLNVNSSVSFVNYAYHVVKKLYLISDRNTIRGDTSLINQFNIFYKPSSQGHAFNKYISESKTVNDKNKIIFYSNSLDKKYQPQIISPLTSVIKINISLYHFLNIGIELIKKLLKLFLVVGIFFLLFSKFKISKYNKDDYLLMLSGLIILVLFIVLPFISFDYDILRTFQQLLAFSIYPIIYGFLYLSKYINKTLGIYLFSIFAVSYLLIYTNVISYFIGGSSLITQLESTTNYYDPNLLHGSEVTSLQWLSKNYDTYNSIYLDDIADLKIYYTNLPEFQFRVNNIPSSIEKNSYVYLDYLNIVKNIYYKNLNGEYLTYTYPISFLDTNKNLLYNNGQTRVYK